MFKVWLHGGNFHSQPSPDTHLELSREEERVACHFFSDKPGYLASSSISGELGVHFDNNNEDISRAFLP